MIKIDSLWKRFGGIAALKDVSLSVGGGEAVVVFGANGAGKSTLINILSTTMKPSSGNIFMGGFNLKNGAVKIRKITGLVSHQTFLYDDLTAVENLSFYCRMFNIKNFELRIQERLKGVGLYSRKNDPIRSYSRGMQQRLAIVRAVIHDPSIILLDEPFTGLDSKASSILLRLLEEWKQRGRAILLATHNLEKGLVVGQRFVILHKGEVVYSVHKDSRGFREMEDKYRQWIEKGG